MHRRKFLILNNGRERIVTFRNKGELLDIVETTKGGKAIRVHTSFLPTTIQFKRRQRMQRRRVVPKREVNGDTLYLRLHGIQHKRTRPIGKVRIANKIRQSKQQRSVSL